MVVFYCINLFLNLIQKVFLTGQKPDLVIINRAASPPEVRLIELTVPWDTAGNIKKSS